MYESVPLINLNTKNKESTSSFHPFMQACYLTIIIYPGGGDGEFCERFLLPPSIIYLVDIGGGLSRQFERSGALLIKIKHSENNNIS